MLLEQPYDSKTLEAFNGTDLTFLVNRYIINDFIYLSKDQRYKKPDFKRGSKVLKNVTLYGVSKDELDIPPLEFPLINNDKGWICFDMRQYYKVDPRTKEITPKNNYEFEFTEFRNILSGLWSVGLIKEQYQFTLPHLTFAKWLTSLITSKFGLGLTEWSDINILTLIYYNRLFSNENRHDQNELDKFIIRFKSQPFSQDAIKRVYEIASDMETLEDYCQKVIEVSGSVRLTGFSVGVLLRLISTSWMGMSYKYYLAVALEYPPIFIAICYYALKNNSFKRTVIGNHADSLSKRGNGEVFIKEVDGFIKMNYGG